MSYFTISDENKIKLNKIIRIVWVLFILFIGYRGYIVASNKWSVVQTHKREAVCPSLLSISRSARDTLIVMKAEPLCNVFVLDNLK